MSTTRATPKRARISLDRSIERLRKQLSDLAAYLGKGIPTRALEEFDRDTEDLIADVLGETSELLEAYEYAEFGEAAGLVNMTDEAPESAGVESQRQRLLQRSRVLESCIAELEARRAAEPKQSQASRQALIGPQVVEHMSADIRSLSQDASLREAGQLMEKYKLGSLLLTDKQAYVGFITDAILARCGRQWPECRHRRQTLHAQASGGYYRRSAHHRGGAHDEGRGHPASGRDARRVDHWRDFGVEYSAVLLRRGVARIMRLSPWDDQKGRSARPQQTRDRGVSSASTLRIRVRRERRWRTFQHPI